MTSAWLFNVGAKLYSIMNAQPVWQRSCQRLAAHFPPGAEPWILDLGCGPGFSAIASARGRPDARLIGLELAPRMLLEAKRRLARSGICDRITLIRADAACLPFRDAALDVVTGHSFLYLVDRPDAVLAEAWRVLRPGGRLVLMEPNEQGVPLRKLLGHSRDPRFLFSILLWRPYSRRHGRFTALKLGATLEAAGFEGFGSDAVVAGLGILGWATKPCSTS